MVSLAVLWFEIPLRGSFPLLFGLSLVYLLCTLGLGLFVSTMSDNQQQAMMTAVFFFMMPMIYLSGFIFPIENMPASSSRSPTSSRCGTTWSSCAASSSRASAWSRSGGTRC